jgi:UDP-glucose 4-epimerase
MKYLLLVGGTGFLGQHIKQYYINIGWGVITIGRSELNDIVVDISSHVDLSKIILHKKVSRIIHAAAVNEQNIPNDLTASYAVNVTATRLLIELAKKNDIKEFVYISTFHVYGKSSGYIDETHHTDPLNDYGLTHLLSEEIVIKLAKINNLTPLIIRPTNIYGIPIDMKLFDRWTLVPFAFIRSAVLESQIVLTTSGRQLRNFVDIIDVLDATDQVGKAIIINVASQDNLSIRDFALKISSIIKDIYNLNCKVTWIDDKAKNDDILVVGNREFDLCRQGDLDKFIVNFTQSVMRSLS